MGIGIACKGLSFEIGADGRWTDVVLRGERVPFPGLPPRFFLAGKPAKITAVSEADGGAVLRLKGDGVAGACRVHPKGDAVRFAVEMEGGGKHDMVGVELPLPAPPVSTLHLPAGRSAGYAIDADSPKGRENGLPCNHRGRQFCAAEIGGNVLSLIGYTKAEQLPRDAFGLTWKEGGFVADDALWLKVACLNGTPWELAAHPSLDGAIARYRRHLERDYGGIPWRDDPNMPDWFAGLKMVVTLDMLRSHGEVMHNYGHVRDLCRELKDAGLGGGALFYLPGCNDRFDAGWPFHGPCDKLGGAGGFAEMIAAIHDAGHRVMVHTNPRGADPYQPYFDEVEDLVFTHDEGIFSLKIGPYVGWPGLSCPTPVDFDSGDQPLGARVQARAATFETCDLPKPMEAFLTVCGVQDFAEGRLRVVLHGRQLTSSAGQFARGDACRFRFPLRFTRGVNEVRLEFLGGVPDLSRATYRIADGVAPPPPDDTRLRSQVWTQPIVRMDAADPRWLGIVRDQFVALVRDYGVDAIHADWLNIRISQDLPFYDALRDALPGVAIGCEYTTELAYGHYHLAQGGSIPEPSPHRITDLAWRLNEPYLKVYYHLCTTEAFVPTGKVCDLDPVPDALTEAQKAEAERLWSEGPKWHVLPNIRLNYRDYGLDPRTLAAFQEVL